jgi:hypothetical protein
MTLAKISGAALVILVLFIGQAGGDGDRWAELRQIDLVLQSARVSGSLVYSSCGFQRQVPHRVPIRFLSDYSGPPRDVLEEMFRDDPKMRIAEEPGIVRMAESDIPNDLLDFKIHHLSFEVFPPELSHGPGAAVMAIQANPEVMAFRKEHNIGPIADRFVGPGDADSPQPVVTGDLSDVTVSQALDHVLKTFPGFWIYENCVNEEGQRTVYFSFLKRIPVRAHKE